MMAVAPTAPRWAALRIIARPLRDHGWPHSHAIMQSGVLLDAEVDAENGLLRAASLPQAPTPLPGEPVLSRGASDAFAERFAADKAQAKPKLHLVCGLWVYSTSSQYGHDDDRHKLARIECLRRNQVEGRFGQFSGGRIFR
jgi:hypothetical protein